MEKTKVHTSCGLTAQIVIEQDAVAEELARTYKALGDPTRVKMLLALAESELCVHDLANLLGMTHSAVSHQLQMLRDLHIVHMPWDYEIHLVYPFFHAQSMMCRKIEVQGTLLNVLQYCCRSHARVQRPCHRSSPHRFSLAQTDF